MRFRAQAKIVLSAAGALALSGAFAQSPPANPTPTRVSPPKDLAAKFKLYTTIDQPTRNQVQFAFISNEAFAALKAGEPYPDGTVLVLENHEIAAEAGGAPLKDKDGRLVPTNRIAGYGVMEKRAGWGDTNPFPPEQDIGDWEFGVFKADGSPVPLDLAPCHACHLPLKAQDYVFTDAKIREAAAKR